MNPYFDTVYTPASAWSPEMLMAALAQAATDHADDLGIGHDAMLALSGCLWMLVRSRISMRELPAPGEPVTVRTWLRRPTPVMSVRDYEFFRGGRSIGYGLQYWVLVDEKKRSITGLRDVPLLWTLPAPQPERKESIRRLVLPEELPEAGAWTVSPEEIDDNGHLNNVVYVRHAQRFAPPETKFFEVIYDHECFLGETIRLFAENGCVRGMKADGSESFRARFKNSQEDIL